MPSQLPAGWLGCGGKQSYSMFIETSDAPDWGPKAKGGHDSSFYDFYICPGSEKIRGSLGVQVHLYTYHPVSCLFIKLGTTLKRATLDLRLLEAISFKSGEVMCLKFFPAEWTVRLSSLFPIVNARLAEELFTFWASYRLIHEADANGALEWWPIINQRCRFEVLGYFFLRYSNSTNSIL